jgi:hypothetical protein
MFPAMDAQGRGGDRREQHRFPDPHPHSVFSWLWALRPAACAAAVIE